MGFSLLTLEKPSPLNTLPFDHCGLISMDLWVSNTYPVSSNLSKLPPLQWGNGQRIAVADRGESPAKNHTQNFYTMATTTFDKVFEGLTVYNHVVNLLIAVYLTAVMARLLFRFYKWARYGALERVALASIARFDNVQADLDEALGEARTVDGLPVGGLGPANVGPAKRNIRFRPHTGRKMADALAAEAYFKFGMRPRSEANLMITRKWMMNQFLLMNDVRKVDANQFIDMALPHSFLPSQSWRHMARIASTDAFAERSADISYTRFWWWPFYTNGYKTASSKL